MARAIEFTKDFGDVKKGSTLPNCSSQLAQKLVNRYKVAKFAEVKAGDASQGQAAAAAGMKDEAKKEAKEIIAKANEDAKAIVDGATKEAEAIKAESKK